MEAMVHTRAHVSASSSHGLPTINGMPGYRLPPSENRMLTYLGRQGGYSPRFLGTDGRSSQPHSGQ